MKTLLLLFAIAMPAAHAVAYDTVKISDEEINKILKAKDIVRGMVRNPDTLVFHELYTKVKGNVVTLKFTCKNDFGVAETHVLDVTVK
jgi:hypothetical protein